jgi:hypothetical protein
MSLQGWEGIVELIRDLWRETTPIVRTCLFTGMGLGMMTTFGWLIFGPSTGILIVPTRFFAFGVLVFVLFLPAFVGAFLGCFVGVLIELLLGKGEPPSAKGKSRRRR